MSLVTHAIMAWWLPDKVLSPKEQPPEIIELTIDEVASPPPPSARTADPAPASVVATAKTEALPSRSPVRGKSAERRGAAPNSHSGQAAEGNQKEDALAATPSSANEGGMPFRAAPGGWDTFLPARPDLNPAHGFRLPPDKPRDLLAAPAAKKGIGEARELPRSLQGGAGVSADIAEDGSIRFHDPKGFAIDGPSVASVGSGAGIGIGGRFDLTDQVMKLAGQDPYAAVKRRMAEETREQRLCMARRHQGERQRQALFALSTKIRHLAARTDLSAAARRESVFAIWDECQEESDSAEQYGAMARATILAVVREVFPEGSALAYRPDELLAMNEKRSSRERFAPYAQVVPTRPHPPDAGQP